jgi:hypothetical protein
VVSGDIITPGPTTGKRAFHKSEVPELCRLVSDVTDTPPARSRVHSMADRARWVRCDAGGDADPLSIMERNGITPC